MWLCENRLKWKTAHFRLPSASQKRAFLSSLLGPQRIILERQDMALRIARTTTTGKSLPTLEPKSGNTSQEDLKCETSMGAFKN